MHGIKNRKKSGFHVDYRYINLGNNNNNNDNVEGRLKRASMRYFVIRNNNIQFPTMMNVLYYFFIA